jgi:uncharacterized membrane protein
MNFFCGLFLSMLVGILCFLTGAIMKYKYPRKINEISGYRTLRSEKNQETWIEAQIYSAKIFCRLGLIALITSGIIYLLFRTDWALYVCLIISLIIILLVIPFTESHLKKKFGDL